MIYDITVIGGGPSGATAAEQLAKKGFKVALIDRAGRIKPCGGAIPPRLIEDFEEKFANPYKAAALGYLDDVIEPNQTRERLCKALGMLLDKEEMRPARKHGNIPL